MDISALPTNSNPKTLSVVVTKRCNMACPWCIARSELRKNKERDVPWTEGTFRKFVEYYEKEKSNIEFVSITGGEPLLEYELVKKIITHIRRIDARLKRQTNIIVHTNARLLTEEMRNFFNANQIAVNVSLNVSGYKGIYSLVEASPLHSKVFELINSLSVFTIRSVTQRGEDYAEDMLFLRKLFPNAAKISVAPDETVFTEWTEKDIDRELQQLRRVRQMSPDFPEWGVHINTLWDTRTPCEYVIFHGDGSVTSRDAPGVMGYETNEMFGLADGLARQLTKGVKRIMLREKWSGFPLNIQILTNLDCNLACTYCYENKGRGRNDAETIKRFIKSRYETEDMQDTDREVTLDFIGGETLMYPDLLDEICEYAAKLHWQKNCTGPLSINVCTNGTLITEREDIQKFLLKWRPYIGFSIDGTREIHDDCRIDTEGRGSYDRAVAGLKWVQTNLCPKLTGAKATYCHKTLDRWAEGVINLIELGFTEIAANTIFEEQFDMDDALIAAREMFRVVDYLFEQGLEDKVHIFQINNGNLDMRHYTPEMGPKSENHCGTCTHMLCLGFDGKLYGCNRFCTMSNPIPIGHMEGDKIVIDRKDFCQEVAKQYELWPEECKKCPYGSQCASCSAIPYEQDGPKAFFARKSQCGFTHAMVAARLYFKMKLLERDAAKKGSSKRLA